MCESPAKPWFIGGGHELTYPGISRSMICGCKSLKGNNLGPPIVTTQAKKWGVFSSGFIQDVAGESSSLVKWFPLIPWARKVQKLWSMLSASSELSLLGAQAAKRRPPELPDENLGVIKQKTEPVCEFIWYLRWIDDAPIFWLRISSLLSCQSVSICLYEVLYHCKLRLQNSCAMELFHHQATFDPALRGPHLCEGGGDDPDPGVAESIAWMVRI